MVVREPACLFAIPGIDDLLGTDPELRGLAGDPAAHLARERRRIEGLLRAGAIAVTGPSSVVLLRPLSWDTRHFGIGCADVVRIYGEDPPLHEVVDQAGRLGVSWLSARCRADRVDLCGALVRAGFELADTSVELGAVLSDPPTSPARPACSEDAPELRRIARTFRQNRFHLDRRVDPARADALYEAWATHDASVVVEENGRPVGFCGWRPPDPDDALRVGALTLIVIAPEARGKGHFPDLVRGVRAALHAAGARVMITSTQVHNAAAMRAFAREGLLPFSARHVFHRWT